ncbi:MAG: ABC transporter permease [Fluviicola sp.]|nr:ABC transporter permease [Fluviicola sp.]MBP6270938.1 ABC transporter permease [Fluviicola sp.]
MHWITRVSVIGITVITAALVILIAAFNGIEQMVAQLYSAYDAPITIRSTQGKTFLENTLDLAAIRSTPGVKNVSRAVEETVILKKQKKWVNAHLVGVDAGYLKDCALDKHLVDGIPAFLDDQQATAIIGATLLDKLDGYISELDGKEELLLYTPLREAKIGSRKSPFMIAPLTVVGKMNYNREVNASELLVPLDFARNQLNYTTDLTALFVAVDSTADPMEIKEALQQQLGSKFEVKTAAEKNELIFKTSRSEKRIVVLILIFIFILAAFNLVASLTMLFIEKKENIQTLIRIGATNQFIFRIFFFEGLLIAAKGIVIGLALGITICALQLNFAFLAMPNSNGEAFPIAFNWKDGLLILSLVSSLSFAASYLPVWYLIKKASYFKATLNAND